MNTTTKGQDVFQTLKWPLRVIVEYELAEDALVNANIKIVDQTRLMMVAQFMGKIDSQALCNMLNWMHDRITQLEIIVHQQLKEKETPSVVTQEEPQVSRPTAEATEPTTRHESMPASVVENFHPGITFRVMGHMPKCPDVIIKQYPVGKEFAHIPQSTYVRWSKCYDTMKDIDENSSEVLVQKSCRLCHPLGASQT